ncbi:response regulator [Desulfohalovibrio reitneri]|uniref:response regulator n=1 Tax=Desulfohalovibrio reitneri TaxID=1307759 RepID=UPI00054CE491|nr:response regulator [Desulfohalovibrio reitneri]
MTDIRVLIVDDEAEFVETLVKRLRKRKLDVAGAKGGEEALTVLEERPVDVAVVDVKMPDMNGLELLKIIKKRWPLTEVIMLTGHASLDLAMQGMESGAYDYLMKPMDLDELLYVIEDANSRRNLMRDADRTEEEPPAQSQG